MNNYYKFDSNLELKFVPFHEGLSFINFSLYLFLSLSHKLNRDLSESFDSICLNILSNSNNISLYSSFFPLFFLPRVY